MYWQRLFVDHLCCRIDVPRQTGSAQDTDRLLGNHFGYRLFSCLLRFIQTVLRPSWTCFSAHPKLVFYIVRRFVARRLAEVEWVELVGFPLQLHHTQLWIDRVYCCGLSYNDNYWSRFEYDWAMMDQRAQVDSLVESRGDTRTSWRWLAWLIETWMLPFLFASLSSLWGHVCINSFIGTHAEISPNGQSVCTWERCFHCALGHWSMEQIMMPFGNCAQTARV